MISLLLGVALADSPVDAWVSVRMRQTHWPIPIDHLEAVDDLPGTEDEEKLITLTGQAEPTFYQTVEASMTVADRWWFNALFDVDTRLLELARFGGGIGFDDAVLYFETGETTGSLVLAGGPRGLGEREQGFTADYSVVALATRMGGTRFGVGLCNYTQPHLYGAYTADALESEIGSQYPRYAVVDPRRRFEMAGVWLSARSLDALVNNAEPEGMVVGEWSEKTAYAVGVDYDFLLGLGRSVASSDAVEALPNPATADLAPQFGVGMYTSYQLGFAYASRGDRFRFGFEAGLEARLHLFMLSAAAPLPKKGSMVRLHPSGDAGFDGAYHVLLGPYAGVGAAF